jgi:hypothetical protein
VNHIPNAVDEIRRPSCLDWKFQVFNWKISDTDVIVKRWASYSEKRSNLYYMSADIFKHKMALAIQLNGHF